MSEITPTVSKSTLNLGYISEVLRRSQTDFTPIRSSGTYDLEELCTHININIWAKYKPIRDSRLFIDPDQLSEAMAAAAYGLNLHSMLDTPALVVTGPITLNYDLPTAPFRLGDFIGYLHTAPVPYTIRCTADTLELITVTALRVILTPSQGSDRAIGFSDIIQAAGIDDNWRLAVILADGECTAPLYFWTAERAVTSLYADSDKYECLCPMNNIRSSLTAGTTYTLVAMLLRTGADWDLTYDNQGYPVSLLPTGTTDALCLATDTPGTDRFQLIATQQDQTKTTLWTALRYLSFTAEPLSNPHTAQSPYGGTAQYSKYLITDINLAFRFHETDYYSDFLTNYRQGYILITAQLACEDSYKATLNDEDLAADDIYALASNTFAVTYQTPLSQAACGEITTGQDEDIVLPLQLALPHLYLDYEPGAASQWHLYIYVEYKNTPNSRRLLADMDIDYDKTGAATVDKYVEYENSQTGGGGSSDGTTPSIAVDLQDQWQPSSVAISGYTIYESFSNYNVGSGIATIKLTIKNKPGFKLYINSYAESNYDYTIAWDLDTQPAASPAYNSTGAKAHTSGAQKDPAAGISNFTEVDYTNDGGTHTIYITYRKDSSVNANNDKGYIAIPNS